MYKRILCAVDLEPGTDDVLRTGETLAASLKAALVLLYVVDSPLLTLTAGSGPIHLPEADAKAMAGAASRIRTQAQEALEALARQLKVPAEVRVLEGTPVAMRILEAIDKEQADLVVLASHSRRAIRRLLVGSVCDKLVRTSHVPVLVIKPPM